MNHTIPFATPGNESSDSEHSQSTQDDLRRERDTPKLVACLLLLPENAQAILSFLQKLVLSCDDQFPDRPAVDGDTSTQSVPEDSWLGHSEAAAYLGVSKSTLYHYSSGEQIERRKLGGRLEYRRSALDNFKQAHTLPPKLSCSLRAYNRVGALLWQVEGVPHGVVPKKRIEVLVDELHGGR